MTVLTVGLGTMDGSASVSSPDADHYRQHTQHPEDGAVGARRADDTCPPSWATATQRALARAGVDSRLAWSDDGHAFGPAFNAAMDRTVRFFDRQLG